MMFLGLIWAALAPLSLVLVIVLLSREFKARLSRWAVPTASAVILGPVAAVWWLDRSEFRAVCTGEGAPVIYRKASADGVFLNSSTANSFGMRYLYDEGFAWIEAPSIYTRGAWVKYTRDTTSASAGAITTTDIPVLTARYEVREVFTQPNAHTGLSQTQIIDRTTGELLAKAGRASFSGGRVKWVLGAWGSSDCPSARTAPAHFNAYYHLAKQTLR